MEKIVMKNITTENVLNAVNSLGRIKLSNNQINDDLKDFGMDSLMFIQISVKLEEYFECEIPDSKLLISEMDTVQKMFNVIMDIYNEGSK